MIRIIPVPRRRAGTLFHYYLTYLFLTSVLLTTTGLCLHTVLKADRLDNQASSYLKTLLRLEDSLRADAAAAVDMESTATELKFHLAEADSTVRWVAVNNVLNRERNTADKLTNADRFIFRKGTSLEFSSKDETAVRLILTEPPRPGRDETGPTTATTRDSRQVEVVLFIGATVRLDSAVQPTPANGPAAGDTATTESEGVN